MPDRDEGLFLEEPLTDEEFEAVLARCIELVQGELAIAARQGLEKVRMDLCGRVHPEGAVLVISPSIHVPMTEVFKLISSARQVRSEAQA